MSDVVVGQDGLEAEKKEAQDNLMNLVQLRAALDTQSQSPSNSESSISDQTTSEHIEHYLELHSGLSRGRTTASDLCRKKVCVGLVDCVPVAVCTAG